MCFLVFEDIFAIGQGNVRRFNVVPSGPWDSLCQSLIFLFFFFSDWIVYIDLSSKRSLTPVSFCCCHPISWRVYSISFIFQGSSFHLVRLLLLFSVTVYISVLRFPFIVMMSILPFCTWVLEWQPLWNPRLLIRTPGTPWCLDYHFP